MLRQVVAVASVRASKGRANRYEQCRALCYGGVPDAKPVRLDETLAEPGCHCRRSLFSDVADVRQHLLAEQFERFHQLVGMFRARGLERQIDEPTPICSWHFFNCATISPGPPQKLIGSTLLTLAGRHPSPATLR
jgi:hypothetical protein